MAREVTKATLGREISKAIIDMDEMIMAALSFGGVARSTHMDPIFAQCVGIVPVSMLLLRALPYAAQTGISVSPTSGYHFQGGVIALSARAILLARPIAEGGGNNNAQVSS